MYPARSAQFALSLLSVALSQVVYAAEEVAVLEEVVVSATRTENTLSKVPASVSVVKREALAAQQISNIADALKILPNVNFGGGPRLDGEIPTIRGYQGASVSLMVDGARRNDVTSGASNALRTSLFLDPFFLKRVEVVRGASSSLYGPGGNGGAMVFSTVSASDMLTAGRNIGSTFKVGYADGNTAKQINGMVYGRGESVDALVGVGYQGFGDIHQPNNAILRPSSGHTISALAKVGVQLDARMRVELSNNSYKKQAFQPNNAQVNTQAQTQLNHIVQNDTVLKFSRLQSSGENGLEARVYNSSLTSQNDRNPALPALQYALNQTDTMGLSLQNSQHFDNHRVTYGVDYFEDKQTSRSGATINAVIPDGKRKVTGLFVQDEIVWGAFRLIPSVRSDGYTTSNATTSTSNSRLSPKVAGLWQINDHANVFASYGESFRAPTLQEMYMNSQVAGLFKFTPNANLQPEVDRTLEIGGQYTREQLFNDADKLKLRATAFQSKDTNLITQVVIGTYARLPPFNFLNSGYGVGIGANFQAQNVASAKRSGLELSANYQTGLWKVNADYSTLRVTDATTGSGLFSPPDKLAVQVRRALPVHNVSVLWNTTAVAAQDYDATLLRRRNGYSVHDVFVTWDAAPQTRVDVGVSNVFDKSYLVYQSSNALANVAEMGRTLRASVTVDF